MSEEKKSNSFIGGLIREPILGFGIKTGHRYSFGEPDLYGELLGAETLPGFLVECPGAGREAPDPEDDRPRPYAVSVNRGPDGRNFWSLDYDIQPSDQDAITRLFGTTGVYPMGSSRSHYLKDPEKSFQEVLKSLKAHQRLGYSVAYPPARKTHEKPVPRWKRVLDRGLRLFLGV